MAFTFDLDNKGYVKKRESYNLEYKQNFQLGDNLALIPQHYSLTLFISA